MRSSGDEAVKNTYSCGTGPWLLKNMKENVRLIVTIKAMQLVEAR
jgi:hypothetical protein